MFKTGTPYQVRNFYGTENDELSQIRCAWDPLSRFVYCVCVVGSNTYFFSNPLSLSITPSFSVG
jgi:hypothetical protein